ncbi:MULTISPECIES: RagB/SusD family nutrient uptake outer membrane protein [unclassified Spirosoma]|uniref:RagB/SusD family nutrient uptake outer membrane protein n=1 Tax=unclassified Spirosoma TaxID=2621999 RepID=UPI0009675478|nr:MULTISPECIES: RagB/SusD family nutrient uptake outer membrane protein [unclassified Spirosoma]MBN8824505.1 RagB/SusD family nutrient uptake outer membrane protein [Spirosoma sp.]OJW70876.1 MAG: RagB/SusD family nutrient uptake outer membrane protein [Spirosoma sp. 48-14]
MKGITCTVGLVFLLMTSCNKNFIELTPVSTVSVDVLYKTDKDFQDAVVGVYSGFRVPYQNFWQFGDLRGDDTKHDLANGLESIRVDNFLTDYSDNILLASWRGYYSVITNANAILAKIGTADPAVVTNKDRHIGETKFLRALAYFNLVRIFGDVPMVTAPVTIEDAYKTGREKVDKIYDEVIIKDLLDAETKLPVKYTGTDVGRATRGAAKALLGKVYLTRKDFVKAEDKLKEVTTLGYALLKNYNDLWDYTKDEHHSEYIFDIEYLAGGLGLGSTFTNTFSLEFQSGGKALVDELSRIYGILPGATAASGGNPTAAMFAVYEPNDLRKDVSVATGVIGADGKFVALSSTGVTSFSKKYMAPLKANNDSPANWKVLRYADVLLMLAEAMNENGKTTEALTYLNQVRQRAGVPAHAGLTKDDAREKIYLERRRELYLEGHRWFDLVRTGRALSVMAPFGMKPYMTVFPLPLTELEIIRNPAVFAQNPGYE